jgi:hypothetical protein
MAQCKVTHLPVPLTIASISSTILICVQSPNSSSQIDVNDSAVWKLCNITIVSESLFIQGAAQKWVGGHAAACVVMSAP